MSYPPPPEGESSQPGPSDPRQPGPDPYGSPGYGQQPHGWHGQGQPYGYDPGRYPYDPDQPYGPPPGHGYGAGQGAPYPYGYHPTGAKPEHPGAVPTLVIGLIALFGGFSCAGLPFVLGPWAWVKGRRTIDEIDASAGRLGGRGMAQAGLVCGIIATALLVLMVIGVAVAVVTFFSAPGGPQGSF